MTTKFKVIVAGAGPGGCIFARDLARKGIDVTVYEKGEYPDLGYDWSDCVERSALADVGFKVPPEGKANTGALVKDPGSKNLERQIFEQYAYPNMKVWSPDYSNVKTIRFRYINTDRRTLGKMLADQAIEAGADIQFGHEVQGILHTGGPSLSTVEVKGFVVKHLDSGTEKEVYADVIADSTGLHAKLRTQLPDATGMARTYNNAEIAHVYRTVRKLRKDAVEKIADHYRYGYRSGYQWVQHLNDGEIDTGACIHSIPNHQDPKDIVDEFIARHPSISDEEIRRGAGLRLMGRSPYSLVAGGFVTIGDAACQTIPMTGYGTGGAMVGGRLAAEVVILAAQAGKKDIASLWDYNWKWFVQSGRGANYAGLNVLRIMLQDLSHDDISFLFRRDILNEEMLTGSINGVFTQPSLKLMAGTIFRGIDRPSLLMKMSKASSVGTQLFRHYLAYPPDWDNIAFTAWRIKAEELFRSAR